MIPDVLTHLFVMVALVIYSRVNKQSMQFTFVLVIYGAAWQMSNYLSLQQDATLLLKVFFQTSVSIGLVYYLIPKLDYTRFTRLFTGLLLFTVGLLLTIIIMDKIASPVAFNHAVDVFSLINIQLMYLELLALLGVTFGMGSGEGKFRKSFDADLYSAASLVRVRSCQKTPYKMAQN